MRITHIKVDIALGAKAEELPHLDRALVEFGDFCTASQSVRAAVSVHAPDGSVLKQPPIVAAE